MLSSWSYIIQLSVPIVKRASMDSWHYSCYLRMRVWGCTLTGRARRWQRCARRFDSCRLHQHPSSVESLARLFMLLNPSIGAAGMKSQPESERSGGSPGSTRKPIKKRIRQYPRTKVSVPVTAFPRGQPIKGRIIDLSLTGAFILLPELLDLTCPVELLIGIPNMYVLFVIAAIVRFDVRPVGDGSCNHYGLGVHFSNISNEDRRALSCVLDSSPGGWLRPP